MEKDRAKIDGKALVGAIPDDWLRPTLDIAETMRGAGERAWIVGGGVRDLILGRAIKDIDLVSAAPPERVEGLFVRTIAVGKAFGIIVIVKDGKELEMATFRRERGYSDSRHPDQIEYADSPEVDALRRDFTCNALYLDPLTGEIEDPTGGLGDLAARQLRAVGEPEERFREDGLRLLRAGRFLAALDLQPAGGLLEAMRLERDSMRGVSPERVLDELSKVLSGPDPARAVRVLSETGVLDLSVPGWAGNPEAVATLGRVLPNAARGHISPVALGLAVLLAPSPHDPKIVEHALGRLEKLKSSKDLRMTVAAVLRMEEQIHALASDPLGAVSPDEVQERGRRVALARDEAFEAGASLAAAWAADSARASASVKRVVANLRELSAAAPSEPVKLSASDAIAEGWKPGPGLGEVLRRAELAALGGAFTDREAALEWLRAAAPG